jgi:hypothetical protein
MPTDSLKSRMDAVERLTKLFKIERMVYLIITTLSLGILLTSAAVLLIEKRADNLELAGLFSSSGLITYTTGRLLKMWNQALQLIAGKATDQL